RPALRRPPGRFRARPSRRRRTARRLRHPAPRDGGLPAAAAAAPARRRAAAAARARAGHARRTARAAPPDAPRARRRAQVDRAAQPPRLVELPDLPLVREGLGVPAVRRRARAAPRRPRADLPPLPPSRAG